MRELPVGNQRIFQRVIQMLAKVADNSKVNKMEVKNLAIIFSPTFFRTQTQNLQDLLQFNHLSAYFIEFCIINYELIFTTVGISLYDQKINYSHMMITIVIINMMMMKYYEKMITTENIRTYLRMYKLIIGI